MKRKPMVWIAAIGAVGIGLVLTKNLVARSAVAAGVKAVTGLTLDVGSMDVGLFNTAVGVKELRLRNPDGFTDPYMVEIPELYVDYDLGAFFRHQVHLQTLRLDLKQLTVVKERHGQLNLDALKVVRASKEKTQRPAQPAPGKAPEIQVDQLHLKIGSVVYKDYSGGGNPKVQTFPVNIDETYDRITNPQALAALIVSRALMQTSIARLTGLDLGAVEAQVGTQVQRAAQAAAAVVGQVGSQATALSDTAKSTAQGAVGAGKEAAGQVVDTMKKTTDVLKKAFSTGQ